MSEFSRTEMEQKIKVLVESDLGNLMGWIIEEGEVKTYYYNERNEIFGLLSLFDKCLDEKAILCLYDVGDTAFESDAFVYRITKSDNKYIANKY